MRRERVRVGKSRTLARVGAWRAKDTDCTVKEGRFQGGKGGGQTKKASLEEAKEA